MPYSIPLERIPFVQDWVRKLDNLNERTDWVKAQIQSLPNDCILLDAGCGSQQFRKFASHLSYKAQDFGQYTIDEKKTIRAKSGLLGSGESSKYRDLDYIGNIWEIDEKDATFDAILCTEVFEHIPYPIETLKEFSRLLKPSGKLILTAPSNCLRHKDPYFYYSGFSDRWYEMFLEVNGFTIDAIEPVGDYYSWLGNMTARTAMSHSFFAKIMLFPAFVYYYSKMKTCTSIDTLCEGYHVLATKR
jgi:SAM-dependent methyltransferase